MTRIGRTLLLVLSLLVLIGGVIAWAEPAVAAIVRDASALNACKARSSLILRCRLITAAAFWSGQQMPNNGYRHSSERCGRGQLFWLAQAQHVHAACTKKGRARFPMRNTACACRQPALTS